MERSIKGILQKEKQKAKCLLQCLCNFRAFVSLNTLSSVKLSCNKCKRFTIHHRRHFAHVCLFAISYTSGVSTGRLSHLSSRSSGAAGGPSPRTGSTQLLLYLHFSRANATGRLYFCFLLKLRNLLGARVRGTGLPSCSCTSMSPGRHY